MQMITANSTAACDEKELEIKWDFFSKDREVSKSPGLSTGPCTHWAENSLSKKQFIACLPAVG